MSILVVGALHLDVVVRASHLPDPDETVIGRSVDYVFGGKGGNQAVAASRMGAQVAFAGRTGTDAFGRTLRAELTARGIDIGQLQKDKGPSGMSVAIVDEAGDYGAVIVSAANFAIDADRITIPQGCKLVLLQNEIPEAVNIDIARKARRAGVPVWLNAAPARALPKDLTASVDLLIVNRVEAAFYGTGTQGPERLTTLGADGVEFRGKRYPARQVRVTSTHGAGDMFLGALAASVAQGETIEAALSRAMSVAAWFVATEPGQRLNAAIPQDLVSAQHNR